VHDQLGSQLGSSSQPARVGKCTNVWRRDLSAGHDIDDSDEEQSDGQDPPLVSEDDSTSEDDDDDKRPTDSHPIKVQGAQLAERLFVWRGARSVHEMSFSLKLQGKRT
jgi:hypothetical protein